MKNRNQKVTFLTILTALVIVPILLAKVPTPVSLTITTGSCAAASTNSVVETANAQNVEFGSTHAGIAGLASMIRLNGSIRGTNASSTGGTVRQHYAISADGSTFTTDNQDRCIEYRLNSNQTVYGSVLIDARGIKAIAPAGVSSQSASNGATNSTLNVSHTE